MPVVRLDHYNLAPLDQERTVRFYEDVIGLKVGFRPDFGVPGYWLYAGEQAVLHLLPDERRTDGPTGRLDHVAFWSNGIGEFLGRLQTLDVKFLLRTIEVAGMHQVFVTDPDGVTVEIGFPSSEAIPAGIERRMGL
jgi:catechol 2,3-dioxygenase-like lactoylglutathione lyase family enzyme